jgi:two-component system cell cycle response regulator
MKILIADDDPVSCRLMQRMLQRSGYDVIVASDGRAASLELSRSNGPKLALIDWMMPELDGPGVCREVRRIPDAPYVYIVLLTSKQSNEDIVEGLEAGADDYLTKPCNPAELKARLLTGRRILQLEEKLVEAREGMRFRATHDGLTRLMNRTAILGSLQQSLDIFQREGIPFSVLLCDIDYFKRVNDIYGHVAGDAILEHFASRLRNCVRSEDLIGRYGGEEFLIILNGCKGDDLPFRAEQVRRAISETPFAIREALLTIFTSIGGTTVDGGNIPLTAELIVEQADAALYQAKANGRNCTRIAERVSLTGDAVDSAGKTLYSEDDFAFHRLH